MITDLTIEQREKIEKALLNAFNLDTLKHMLLLKLGIKIQDELDTKRGLKFIISDLLDLQFEGGIDRLLQSAARYNPYNPKLNGVLLEFNVGQFQSVPKENVTVDFNLDQQNLEKIIQKRAPLIKFNDFIKNLSNLGSRICRIEIPKGQPMGTGWLVGPDLLLTAYHVVEKVVKKEYGIDHTDLYFRFNYSSDNNGQLLSIGKICGVSRNDWLIDFCPYSLNDIGKSTSDPGKDELDYALIRLDKTVGNDSMPDGEKRGWIELSEKPVIMSVNDFVIIPQHPFGRTLELAFGELREYNKSGNRVRYDANTDQGSSGSPCFSINLAPFGLHHSTDPVPAGKFNQAIPLREIIKRMKERNVSPFWTQ